MKKSKDNFKWFKNLNTKLSDKQKKNKILQYNQKIKKAEIKISTMLSKIDVSKSIEKEKIKKIEFRFTKAEQKNQAKVDILEKNNQSKIQKIENKFNDQSKKESSGKNRDSKIEIISGKKQTALVEVETIFRQKLDDLKKILANDKKKKILATRSAKQKNIFLDAEINETKKRIIEYKKMLTKISSNQYYEYKKEINNDIKKRNLKREEDKSNRNYMRIILKGANKMANQRHLMAIRNGVVLSMPLIIVGSLFMIIANFPISNDQHATNKFVGDLLPLKWKEAFVSIFKILIGVISVIVSFGVASSLGASYKMDKTTSGILGFVAFILWVFPSAMLEGGAHPYNVMILGNPTEAYKASEIIQNGGLLLSSLGSGGMFAALLTSIFIIELYRLVLKYNITIRLPNQVPKSVSNSFLILVPILIYSIIVFFVGYIWRVDLINGLNTVFRPLNAFLTRNLGGVSILVLLITLFWSVGLHGVAIFNAIIRPIWTRVIVENSENFANHLPIKHTYPEPFLQWTIWLGGAGATLGLVIVTLIFARSKQLKAVGRASIIPGIFNINEPVIFGYPIMLNVLMIIPFILVPQVLVFSTWLFQIHIFKFSWVAVVPWTLPGPIGAFFASGSQYGAAITSTINIIISAILYLPFLLIYDKQLVAQEKGKLKQEVEFIEKVDKIKVRQ